MPKLASYVVDADGAQNRLRLHHVDQDVPVAFPGAGGCKVRTAAPGERSDRFAMARREPDVSPT